MKSHALGKLSAAVAAFAVLASHARAQLQWSEYSDLAQTISGTAYVAGQQINANVATGGDVTTGGASASVSFTVPAGASVDFATSNFTPFSLAASSPSAKVTFTFAASGGLTGSTTRTFTLALLNSSGATLIHRGYTAIANLGNNPQDFEFYATPLSGVTAPAGALLAAATADKLSSGKVTGLTFANGTTYTGAFMLNFVSGNVQMGTSSSSALAGVSISAGSTLLTGDGTSIGGVFPNPTFAPNTFVLAYFNGTGAPVTVTLGSLSLVPVGVPTITSQPSSTATSIGAPAAFTVTAVANPAATYEWFYTAPGGSPVPLSDGTQADQSVITGSATASLAIGNAQADEDGGGFSVVVTNSVGSTPSSTATLSVSAEATPPVITAQPVSASANAGATVSFAAAASGGPAPALQWFFVPNGGAAVALSDGGGISGSATGTLTLTTANPTEAGSYFAVATNISGTATTSSATLAIVNAGPSITALAPNASSGAVCIDSALSVSFSDNVVLGSTGTVRIYNASTNALVDTIDVGASGLTAAQILAADGIEAIESSKTLEGQAFNYYPIIVSGSTATIYPHQALAYGTGYYVTIDTGVFIDSRTDNAFIGIYDAATWNFSTKATPPAAPASTLVVAADGTGDFCTVQGALDFLPGGNTSPVTISIANGTYYGLIFDNGRSNVTFRGQSRTGTVLEYANNNTFDPVGGSFYHRGAFEAYASNLVFMNLTVHNTTPHGGSQAEALLVQGSQEIITDVSLYSFQDTLQINGSAYISDSYIEGDVDFMWGQGPNFFTNCELKAATSSGYYAQVRNGQVNGTANHGNVYVNCRLDSEPGVTASYLARIDPTQFPFSEVVYIGCQLGANINAAGWLLNNATSGPTINFAYAGLVDLRGNPYNTAAWQFAQAITSPTVLQDYETPSYVLNGWTPVLSPAILSQPSSLSVPSGQTAAFSTLAAAVPDPTYQWFFNGIALTDGAQSDGSVISGSATASLNVEAATAAEAGAYYAVATSGGASTTTATATLTVTIALPGFTQQPLAQSASVGGSASFSAAASNAASYQWFFDGAPISGNPTATSSTLSVGPISPSSEGNYSVVASDASGTTVSSSAFLNVTAGAGQPTLPVIPNGVFLVTNYGAVGDGATDNTVALQNAVAAALAAGGGTVEVPASASAYLTGPITLGSSINLQVDAGATLQALPMARYPDIANSPANVITIAGASNVEISGSGTIDGNGAAWWAAFGLSGTVKRPQLVKFLGSTEVLVTNVTISNSPIEHLVIDAGNNITVDAVTIAAPSTSPNTDGIDPDGSNFLIENSSIAVGDDNIAVKPQNSSCSNFVITGCAFGAGHGMSVGGQTNDGLDGLVVTDCTFVGTTNGLRLKADATEGGLVRDLAFSNITMTNVTYPIVFYSYYNVIGTIGNASGSSAVTPATVQGFNITPPDSLGSATIPAWQNITISNLTATGATGYSTLWGLPLASGLISNVTLNNVTITGGPGIEIYDATNVQLTGTTSVGPAVTANALAITGQPIGQSISAGSEVSFAVTAVGTSGTTGATPTYQWTYNGTPLSNGPQADGSVVAGATSATLSLSNAQVDDAGAYAVVASNTLDGYDASEGSLAPNSLPVSATSSPAILGVVPVAATFTLGNLSQTYDGSPKGVSVTTNPPGVPVQVTYNGSPSLPTAAGSYAVVATSASPDYSGSGSGVLVISQATTTLTLGTTALTYDGSVQAPVPVTVPGNLAVLVTYNGLPGVVTPQNGTVAAYASAVGQTLYVAVAGDIANPAYGTGPFAMNSDIGAAAVYSGILSSGQSAVLQIQILADEASYGAGTQNGVTTQGEGAAGGSFQIVGIATTGFSAGPLTVGTYAVSGTIIDPNYTGTGTGTVTITQATPVLSWATPAAITYGTALGASQLDAQSGVAGSFIYVPAAGMVPQAGTNQALSATFAPADTLDYAPAAIATTLTINPEPVVVDLGGLLQTYDGSQESVAVTTVPGGLPFSVAYDGASSAPVNAGSYSVVAIVTDPNHVGSATGTLVIGQAPAAVALGLVNQTYDGTPKAVAVTTTPAGLATAVTYNGSPTAPTAAGTYSVFAQITDPNFTGSVAGTLTISDGAASITLGSLSQMYDGSPEPATATTIPAGLSVSLTYNGAPQVPTLPGSYTVVATISDANYAGSATGTLVIGITALVNHAPSINGGIDGSLQVLSGQSFAFNGSTFVSGDALVPGTPTVKLNGQPLFEGTVVGTGSASPAGYTIMLNGGSVLRHLLLRTNPIGMPTVGAPALPSGTRNVSLNSTTQSVGNFATLDNLTLNSNAGLVTVPPGTYGSFTANGGSGFILGVSGSPAPSVYNLQGLTLNSGSQIQVVGPVTLIVASSVTLNSSAGNSSFPEWLTIEVASGGVTVNQSATLNGDVVAPSGTATINGTVNGTVISSWLTINGSGLLNQSP
jgi:polygalacturonase